MSCLWTYESNNKYHSFEFLWGNAIQFILYNSVSSTGFVFSNKWCIYFNKKTYFQEKRNIFCWDNFWRKIKLNYIEIIRNTIIFIAVCINIYILINLFLEKNAREKDENYEIKNNKFMISIVVIFILYIIYGILRNFK